jgi:hypothetical protein
LFTSAGAGLGPLPSIAPAGALEARMRVLDGLLARVAWTMWLEREVTSTSNGTTGFSMWSGKLLACPSPLFRGAWELRGCGGVALGRIATTVRGVRSPHDPASLHAAALLGADLSVAVGPRIRMRAGVDGSLALSSHRYFALGKAGLAEVHDASRLGLQLELGVGVALF